MKKEKNYGTKETLYVLNKIEDIRKVTPKRYLLRYTIENFFGEDKIRKEISSAKEDEIIFDIERWGVFKINDAEIIKDNNERIYYLDLDHDRFKEIHLDHIKILKKQVNDGVVYSGIIKNKLNFYSETCDAEYKTGIWQFKRGKKGYELLTFFQRNKNAIWKVEEIKKFCNKNIVIKKHKFKGEKDIRDTIREIRYRLKVKKGEFFPIFKQKEGWIWLEKS